MTLRTGRAPRRASGARGLRRTVSTIGVLITALVLVGCGSAGVHTQDPTTDPTTGAHSTNPSFSSVSDPTSPTWTPPPYGDAQPAVDAYLAMLQAGYAAFRDPAHADMAAIEKYADGQIRTVYAHELDQARQQGIAYRGTPDTARVTVVSVNMAASPPEVVLRDCALEPATDPWTAYSVETGRALPTPTPTVAPPYANTITASRISGAWHIFSYVTDPSQTCQP